MYSILLLLPRAPPVLGPQIWPQAGPGGSPCIRIFDRYDLTGERHKKLGPRTLERFEGSSIVLAVFTGTHLY